MTSIGTFLCEATFTEEHEGSLQHLSGRQAGAMAWAPESGGAILSLPLAYGVARRGRGRRGGTRLRAAGAASSTRATIFSW